ncbi:hypothetical protein KIL84_005403 [Mauremys mutica]|uniref:Uncharacterized protein n=1 Tax=Mauremys mutica TaxID=74926 RepID=A0A9D4AYW7_9SAUR|nr:hypothetical protein KIL84_005403 [Mauremys mutica]
MIGVAETGYPVIYPVQDEFSGDRSTDFIDFVHWWRGAKELNGELGTISSNTDKKLLNPENPSFNDYSEPIRQRTSMTFFSKFNYRMLISLPTTKPNTPVKTAAICMIIKGSNLFEKYTVTVEAPVGRLTVKITGFRSQQKLHHTEKSKDCSLQNPVKP